MAANRLAISYAAASRRIVINAQVVDSLKVFRKEHRLEISLTVEANEDGQLKGIMVRLSTFENRWLLTFFFKVEALSEATKTYTPLQMSSEAYESDSMLPPFLKSSASTKLVLIVHLDADKPIPETKWVKSGDLQEWLKTMFGRMFWTTGDADGWEKKIDVVDPDPVRVSNSLQTLDIKNFKGSDDMDDPRRLGDERKRWCSERTPAIHQNASLRNGQHLRNPAPTCPWRARDAVLTIYLHGSSNTKQRPRSTAISNRRVLTRLATNARLTRCARFVPDSSRICKKGGWGQGKS